MFLNKIIAAMVCLTGISLFPAPCSNAAARSSRLGLLDCVQTSLARQAGIHLGKLDVETAAGVHQEVSGQFDTRIQFSTGYDQTRTTLSETEQTLLSQDTLVSTTSSYSIGLGKEFRSGIDINLQVQTIRTETDGPSAAPSNRSGAYLVINLPLLRGAGSQANAGMEIAALQDEKNARIKLRRNICTAVYEVTTAYWQFVMHYDRLQQYLEAETRAKELYEQSRHLVEADELPAVELDEVLANLSDKQTARIAEEQSLMESLQTLGLAMGISFHELDSIPVPSDNFNIIPSRQPALDTIYRSALIKHALSSRHDLLAAQGYEKSAAARMKVLENQSRSSLDLGMKIGYEGFQENSSYDAMLTTPFSNLPGLSWQASLTYEFPVENNEAQGRLSQQRVQLRRLQVSRKELMRTIQINIDTILSILRKNRAELENAQKTEELYARAVANQLLKYKLGMATQIDVINTQDRMIQARLNKIAAQYKYMLAVTKLRFESATLVSFKEEQAQVGMEMLTTPPVIHSQATVAD